LEREEEMISPYKDEGLDPDFGASTNNPFVPVAYQVTVSAAK